MGSQHSLGPDAVALVDDGLRDWVLAVRTADAPSAESIGVDALRAAQRARAATRPAGPAVHHVEDLVAGRRVPVRLRACTGSAPGGVVRARRRFRDG